MSGHSHWAGIKHRKGINDAKRARIFTRLAKPIVIAVREGGPNSETNFKLRLAIEKAREFNMPKDNIEKAIKRGSGKDKENELYEIIYEATGPKSIMLLIKTTTDNKNRTLGEIKTILTKNGGRFGEAGSSMWNFEQVGKIAIKIEDKKDIERIEIEAIEAGAKDIQQENDLLNVYTEVKDLQKVQECLTDKNLPISEISLSYLPKNILRIDEKTRLTYEKLLDALSEQDDTEEVFDNL